MYHVRRYFLGHGCRKSRLAGEVFCGVLTGGGHDEAGQEKDSQDDDTHTEWMTHLARSFKRAKPKRTRTEKKTAAQWRREAPETVAYVKANY
jgi:hypothetical protein